MPLRPRLRRHPQRVCAANTCGDAVALLACGCDGRTFVTGCITPDRPHQHTGACSDGGPAPQDGGPVVGDAPSTDAPALAFCPVEVDRNTAQNPTFRYRRAAFALPTGAAATPDAGAALEVAGTWVGTRRLAAPIVVGCEADDPARGVPRRHGDPGAAGQRADARARGHHRRGGALRAHRRDARHAPRPGVAVGRRHAVQYSGELTVRRASDNALMLAIVTAGAFSAVPDLGLSVDRAAAVCRSRPEPICSRVLHAFALQFGSGSGARIIPPGDAAVLNEGGAFLCRNRLAYQRVPSGGTECADLTPSVTSFEIVRQP